MSKTGAPRKSFRRYVEEKRSETIDVPDDDGTVLLALPLPQFWPEEAAAAARGEDGVRLLELLVGDDGAAAFFDAMADTGLSRHVLAGNVLAWIIEEEMGTDLGESLGSAPS